MSLRLTHIIYNNNSVYNNPRLVDGLDNVSGFSSPFSYHFKQRYCNLANQALMKFSFLPTFWRNIKMTNFIYKIKHTVTSMISSANLAFSVHCHCAVWGGGDGWHLWVTLHGGVRQGLGGQQGAGVLVVTRGDQVTVGARVSHAVVAYASQKLCTCLVLVCCEQSC